MKVKRESEITQSCLTFCNPMDGSLPGSSAHGIFQARVLEWGAIAFSNYTLLEDMDYSSLLLNSEPLLLIYFLCSSLYL